MINAGKTKIAVILGGPSAEYEVSLNTGQNIINALDKKKYSVRPVYISQVGKWYFLDSVQNDKKWSKTIISDLKSSNEQDTEKALKKLKEDSDVVFIALHGEFGEDGQIQRLLASQNIKYTGSNAKASGQAMDKQTANEIFKANNLLVPSYHILTEHQQIKALHLNFPLVVKPVDRGSSVGTHMVKNSDELKAAVKDALKFSSRAMLQEFIEGAEATCGVLEIDGIARALPVTLIRPKTSDWFDYEAKYSPGASEEITPAPMAEELTQKIQTTALAAHKALGCHSYSRSDFIINENNVYILETNTLPGMTDTSLLPQAALAAGFSFSILLDLIVQNSRN